MQLNPFLLLYMGFQLGTGFEYETYYHPIDCWVQFGGTVKNELGYTVRHFQGETTTLKHLISGMIEIVRNDCYNR